MHPIDRSEMAATRWSPWARLAVAILAPALIAFVLVAGEWTREPASSPPSEKASPPAVARPQGNPMSEQVRDEGPALANAGSQPGPIDGNISPRTESALPKSLAVAPPKVPGPADRAIERRESP